MAQSLAFLPPDSNILSRRNIIIADLRELVGPEGIVSEALELVPFETDGFIACRNLPLAVALPRTTAEVADIIFFLCSQQASYVTGSEIHINGGQHV